MKIYFKSGCVDLNRLVELYGGFELVYSDEGKPYSLSVEFITNYGVKNRITVARGSFKECNSCRREILRRYGLGDGAYRLEEPFKVVSGGEVDEDK